MVQGQTTMASGGLVPLATGAVHSWRPKTRNWPGAAAKRSAKKRSMSVGLEGTVSPASILSTICPAWETIR